MRQLPHTSCQITGAKDVGDFVLHDRRAHVPGNASLNLMLIGVWKYTMLHCTEEHDIAFVRP